MRLLLDTNILISAALFPKGRAAEAFRLAVCYHDAILCDYSFGEMRDVFKRKFPDKLDALEDFIVAISASLEVVPTSDKKAGAEGSIRDIADWPIYRSAVESRAEGILTGDKDLLDSGITKPEILSVAVFLDREEIG